MSANLHVAAYATNVLNIQAIAFDVLEDKHLAMQWLLTPNVLLNENRPIDALATERGCERVRQLLARLEHGVGL
jgi:putative toxin-antitoxin system antitoxin component (TIGR02293 family)